MDGYGNQARVKVTGDTLFLSNFPSGWLITAAGCVPRATGDTYACEIQGG